VLAPGCEPDRFLLLLHHRADAARCAHSDLERVGLHVAVLGLARVGLHRDGFVADVLGLVDGLRFGDRAAGGIVADE
jgi:hypothetical protein